MKIGEKVTLKGTSNSSIENLIGFVLEQNFDAFTSLPKLRKCINSEYLPVLNVQDAAQWMKVVQSVSDFNFFDIQNYKAGEAPDFDLMNIFSNFRDELLIAGDLTYNPERHTLKLTRQVSPPLSAYEYMGHSKLNIIPTGRDYGLLFE
jgi:hypothetical protein